MTEKIAISSLAGMNCSQGDHGFWDVQREQEVDEDFLHGRVIRRIETNDDHQVVLVLEEVSNG